MADYALKEPQRGDRITADWARELVRAVRSMRLSAGPGLRLTRTPSGTTVSVNPVAFQAAKPVELAASSADHFGDASGANKEPAWNIADDKPAILETAGAKILVDSRGNVISWTTPSPGDGPYDDPEEPSAPPPCGNPLNGDVTDNPLDRPAADRGTDYNPLDYPGRGGYTPESSGEQC